MPINLSYESTLTTPPPSNNTNYRSTPTIYLNGHPLPPHLTTLARPNQTLLSFLRDTLHLTGSKLGCGEGGCGACTVVLSRYDTLRQTVVHKAVNACLFPVLGVDGWCVTTVEGLGSFRHVIGGDDEKEDNLHPIQRAMVDMHGSQCGYCTPGIIMALYGLFAQDCMLPESVVSDDDMNSSSSKSNVSEQKVQQRQAYLEEHLDGNLCRCTGYRPIWDAARSLINCHTATTVEDVEEIRGPCGVACNECPERESCDLDCNLEAKKRQEQMNGCVECCGGGDET